MNDFISKALELMRQDGLVADNLIGDGQWHRCSVTDKNRRNLDGSYKYFSDEKIFPPTVIWNNFFAGINGKHSAKTEKAMTAKERKAYQECIKAAQKEREKEQEKKWAEAAKKAQIDWGNAKEAGADHFYLRMKSVKPYGIRVNDAGELLIPVFGENGQLQSYERILPREKDNKRYFPGGKIQDGYFPICASDRSGNGPLVICEGYATGASIYEATGFTVLIAFNAGNLLAVAKLARRKYKKRPICIAADFDVPANEKARQDYPEPGGVGVYKAREAAQAIGGHLAICPSNNGGKMDFNDLANADSLKRVKQEIEKAIQGEPIKGKPVITYRPGQIIRILEELEAVLHGYVFQYGGRLVNVIRLPQETFYGKVSLKAGTAVINPLDTDDLNVLASKYADWFKYDARKDTDLPCDPPTRIIKSLTGNRGFWSLQPIFGLTTSPIIRFDGSILNKAGYDAETGLFADFDPAIFPKVAANPTRKEAESALAILKTAISEFPFENDIDRAVALSAMLTAVARPSLPTSPLFAFSAPCPGTGKTTLANVMAIMATGKEAPAFNYVPDPDEMRKSFFSLLSCGAQVVLIDNAVGVINNPLLNTTISQCELTDRILGKNEKTMTVSTKALFMITGNNLIFADDMIRRTLYCTLDANMERPAERRFDRPDFMQWLLDKRANLVAAALTILRAYHVAGRPDKLPPLNTYGDWSNLIRSALVWLGEADPVKSQRKIESNDPEREALSAVLTAWIEHFGDYAVSTKELLSRIPPDGQNIMPDTQIELYQSLINAVPHGKELTGRILGKWLAKYEGRIVDNMRIVKRGDKQKIALWGVKKVGSN